MNALVSGGGKGLGAAIVTDLLAHGWRVATFSRRRSSVVDQLERLHATDGRYFWEPFDITDTPALRQLVARAVERFDRIDALVNNAGTLVEGVLPLMRPQAIHDAIALNLESTIHLTQACTRTMLRQGSGVVLNISSLNGIRGHAGVSVYSATKAGLDGFTRSLARELGPRGIRVNSLAPGFFESDMTRDLGAKDRDQIVRRTPLGRLGTVDDLVGAARFLLSPEARFITGQTLVVDGGLTC